MKVAVIAHTGKSFGGGLPELRRILERRGVHDLRWREVPKSRKARSPKSRNCPAIRPNKVRKGSTIRLLPLPWFAICRAP